MTTTSAPVVEHPTVGERVERGKRARGRVPRSTFGAWTPPADRPDPVEVLEAQGATRVPELLPIRHVRMAASPFAFYRGAAAVMAADLADQPRTGLRVQLCGDAHLLNFGGFASPERTLVFDLNDFDETLPGPFEWDVQRLAASFEIAARDRGFDDAERARVVLTAARAYREAMRGFAAMGNLDVWYTRLTVEDVAARYGAERGAKALQAFRRNVEKAESKDRLKAKAKLTETVGGELRFRADPPLLVPIRDLLAGHDAHDLEALVRAALRSYRHSLPADRRHLLEGYRFVDLARKVVGVGSVGTRCWVALLVGRDDDDPLFLQVKEAEASVLEAHLGASGFANHGQRVVEGQRLLQAASDIFLGWQAVDGVDGRRHDYYMRQLWDWKASASVETMDPGTLEIYARICGWTLARGHARSGDRIAIAAYLGSGDTFDRSMATFAAAYAERNEADHRAMLDAVSSGRLPAEPLSARRR